MKLFEKKNFISHSGIPLDWKIECDKLVNNYEEIVAINAPRLPPFKEVFGVPRGGTKLAAAFSKYKSTTGSTLDYTLIVDDIYTIGQSIFDLVKEKEINWDEWYGFVIFAREPIKYPYITAFWICGL